MPLKKVWKTKASYTEAARFAFDAGYSPLLAQLLINRGISDTKSASSFLNPRLADILDPMQLKDMNTGLGLIWDVIQARGLVTIFGDYDADGLTGTALLVNLFSCLDIPVAYYIPNRLSEGYSLNQKALEKIHARGTALIITVDCGSSNTREIEFALSLGMKVLVTDHHQTPDEFCPVCPVINPHQPDCSFPFKDLSGVGVAFYLAIALRGFLREKGWFKARSEPDLRTFLDLVALGTLADRVPLLSQNRLLVNSGLEIMAASRWPGIRAMKEVSDIQGSGVTAEDLTYRLVPRLNAPGRVDDPGIAAQVLTCDDPFSAKELALKLNSANSLRQNIERAIFNRIEEIIESGGGIGDRKTLFLAAEDWHRGVLGIVASKLVDKYYRPSLVLCLQNGLAIGSGRSIDGFNMFQCLSRFSHLFEKFGGHSHAAGFTLRTENLKLLEKELETLAGELLGDSELTATLEVDCELPLQDVTNEAIEQIQLLAPFGVGNPEPAFLAKSLMVLESRVVGEHHLKLRVRQIGDEKVFHAIGFGLANGHPLEGKLVDMVFTPEINRWQGYENIQLRIADIRKC